MPARDISILNALNTDDTAGLSFEQPLLDFDTFTNLTHNPVVPVLGDGATDSKYHGSFTVPVGYDTTGTTSVKLTMLANGAGTYDLDFSFIAKASASETIDVAAATPVTVSAAGSGANFNLDLVTFALTASDFAAGDIVFWTLLRDNAPTDSIAADYAILDLRFFFDEA